MHLQITNKTTLALDAFRFSFGSAGALKPTSSLTTPGKTVDVEGNETEVVTKGRHDPCVGIRATPIAEAMVALVLMDHFLRHRGQIGE